jgi:hypothetical protein
VADSPNGVQFHENSGLEYRAQLDGKSYAVNSLRYDTVSLKLLDARTVEVSWMRNGKILQKSRETVSADGQELTFQLEGDMQGGGHHVLRYVYRKQ